MIPGSDAQQGAAAGMATVGVEAGFNGLSRARAVAGDVLAGIFGGVPWEMGPDAIVDAVTVLGVVL